MGARYYDSRSGSFLSSDPVPYPFCMDLYAYVNGDPINYFDPDGRCYSKVRDIVEPFVLDGWNDFNQGINQGLLYKPFALENSENFLNHTSSPSFGIGEVLGRYQAVENILTRRPEDCVYAEIPVRNAARAIEKVVRTIGIKILDKISSRLISSIANNSFSKKLNLDALSKAGQVHDRNGLTRAGRALDKHGGRNESIFPKAFGNPTQKNLQGQFHLDDILTDPKGILINDFERNGFKIYSRDGRGVYFSSDGKFRGFIEKQYE